MASAIDVLPMLFKQVKSFILWQWWQAADAQHGCKFSGRFYIDRKPCLQRLHCNTSYLTAVANDYSYDVIYSRIVDGTCVAGDVLVGLSTSGNSKIY